MKYIIKTLGGTVEYDVPIIKMQECSLDDIFSKDLLILSPFYIFSHEKRFMVYNSNEQKLEELKAEYRGILDRLDELEKDRIIGAFDKRVIIELSSDVLKEIARKYENIQKGVGGMMRGPMIETEAKRMLNKGINKEKRETALRMIQDGVLPIEKIAKYSGLAIKELEELTKLGTV